MEKKEAMVILALMQANWAHVEVSELTTGVWCEHLRDIPPASGLAVANELISTSEHFPTVSEFRTAWRAHLRKERDWEYRPAIHARAAIEEGDQQNQPKRPTQRDVNLAGIKLARVALADARPMQVKPEQQAE